MSSSTRSRPPAPKIARVPQGAARSAGPRQKPAPTPAQPPAALGAAALTLAFTTGEFVSTVEFKLNYLHPVRLHDQLVARAAVEHTGNKLLVSSAVIYRLEADGQEIAVARGLGTFNRYPASKRDFSQLLTE